LVRLFSSRAGWFRGLFLASLFNLVLVAIVVAVGYFVIGWNEFHTLWLFHLGVIWGSGLYGTGNQTVISADELRSALAAIPVNEAYAIPVALIGGLGLVIAGSVSILKSPQHNPAGIMSIGAGIAGALSALFVLKHYDFHYVAGVSATLPAGVVSAYLLAKSWNYKIGPTHAAIAFVAIAVMAFPVAETLRDSLERYSAKSRMAEMDLKEIMELTSGSKRVVDFAYRVPFSQYGEGFVLHYADVQPLTDEYVKIRRGVTNSLAEGWVTEDVGAYVIDKDYFPNANAVKQASNVDLLGPKPVQYKEGDKLIELRTVFLLIRN
jgi:hypothetical protein